MRGMFEQQPKGSPVQSMLDDPFEVEPATGLQNSGGFGGRRSPGRDVMDDTEVEYRVVTLVTAFDPWGGFEVGGVPMPTRTRPS